MTKPIPCGTHNLSANVPIDEWEALKARSKDIVHQMKFMSPMKRFATGLALAS